MLKHPKAKGSKFERDIAQTLRQSGLSKNAQRQVLSGGAFGLPGDIRNLDIPICIECKHHEKTHFQEWYLQAEEAAPKTKIPVVVWRESLGQPFAFLKWNDLLEIMTYAVQGGWGDRLSFHK